MMNANAPRSKIVLTEGTRKKIANRWEELQPRLKLETQVRPSHIFYDREWHYNWILELLAKNILMRDIRRLDLDDPRCTRSILELRVRKFVEKRARRKPGTGITASSKKSLLRRVN
jgi:hypothetical protein